MPETVRCWLVERGYNNRDLITLNYATPAGDRLCRRGLAAQAVDASTVTAARDVSPDDLDGSRTPRHASGTWTSRARQSEHDPDDEI